VASQTARAALTGTTTLAKNAYKVPVFEALGRHVIIDAASQT